MLSFQKPQEKDAEPTRSLPEGSIVFGQKGRPVSDTTRYASQGPHKTGLMFGQSTGPLAGRLELNNSGRDKSDDMSMLGTGSMRTGGSKGNAHDTEVQAPKLSVKEAALQRQKRLAQEAGVDFEGNKANRHKPDTVASQKRMSVREAARIRQEKLAREAMERGEVFTRVVGVDGKITVSGSRKGAGVQDTEANGLGAAQSAPSDSKASIPRPKTFAEIMAEKRKASSESAMGQIPQSPDSKSKRGTVGHVPKSSHVSSAAAGEPRVPVGDQKNMPDVSRQKTQLPKSVTVAKPVISACAGKGAASKPEDPQPKKRKLDRTSIGTASAAPLRGPKQDDIPEDNPIARDSAAKTLSDRDAETDIENYLTDPLLPVDEDGDELEMDKQLREFDSLFG